MANLLAFGMGPQELMILLVIMLVLFGGSKLPSLMRNMGRSVNEFKRGVHETGDDEKPSDDDDDSDKA